MMQHTHRFSINCNLFSLNVFPFPYAVFTEVARFIMPHPHVSYSHLNYSDISMHNLKYFSILLSVLIKFTNIEVYYTQYILKCNGKNLIKRKM